MLWHILIFLLLKIEHLLLKIENWKLGIEDWVLKIGKGLISKSKLPLSLEGEVGRGG